jgi:hypothetical protein
MLKVTIQGGSRMAFSMREASLNNMVYRDILMQIYAII